MYVGFAVLDISKTCLYRFHYDVMPKLVGDDKFSLLYTDTDSLIYSIQTDDIYRKIKANIEHLWGRGEEEEKEEEEGAGEEEEGAGGEEEEDQERRRKVEEGGREEDGAEEEEEEEQERRRKRREEEGAGGRGAGPECT